MVKKMTDDHRNTRGKTALTHRGVETLRADPAPYRICDLRCPGLAIRVAPSGGKTWDLAFRIRKSGVYRRLSLGPFPAVSLDTARARATALTDAAKAGRDLLAEERSAKAAAEARMTVGQLVEQYLSRMVRGRLRTAVQMELRLKRTFLPLNSRYVDELRRRDLRQVLDAVAERGAVREAQQQRQVARVMFKWALSQDIIEADPSAGLASYGASPRRDRVLSMDEIKTLWDWIETSDLPGDYGLALEFQIATGARIGEVGGIRAEEIDQTNWIWTLPAERSKNGRPRVTPLAGIAREIIEAKLETTNAGPLFRTEHGDVLTSNCVASMFVKRRKSMPLAHFTSHDLRRTVATQLVELGFSYEVVAAVLGHEVGTKEVRTLI
jgi:integrase